MHFNTDIESLIYKYLMGRLSSDERTSLDQWIGEIPENRILFDQICDRKEILRKTHFFDRHPQEKGWKNLESRIYKKKRVVRRRWTIAASLMLPLIVGTCFFMLRENQHMLVVKERSVLPGIARAQLELSDGRIIELHQDSVYSMVLTGGERLENNVGKITYEQDSAGYFTGEYNEIRTPRGGEYQIELPDGTRVWLNAESKLRFPRKFSGDERNVYVRGELYFEVARDLNRPFRVEIENAYTVEVTGTEFNVRAYEDGPRLTTLVSGGVTVRMKDETVHLRPGEEAVREQGEDMIRVRKVDVDSRIAWHRGYFLFDNMRMEDIMNELARWYNVTVFFENQKVRDERFSVELRRHDNFEQVLDLIERAGMINITVKGDVIFVK